MPPATFAPRATFAAAPAKRGASCQASSSHVAAWGRTTSSAAARGPRVVGGARFGAVSRTSRSVTSPVVCAARKDRGRNLNSIEHELHMKYGNHESPSTSYGNGEPLPQCDVIGLGQAMVDFAASTHDGLLEKFELDKGLRKVIDHEERSNVLSTIDGSDYKVSAGGSLSNSLVALARLGSASAIINGTPEMRVGIVGSVGADPLGDFYRAKVGKAGLHWMSEPHEDGTTGSVIVLTTPDANRTMLSCTGTSDRLHIDPAVEDAIAASRLLVIEGYLWELPETIDAIRDAVKVARRNGCKVVLTASDQTIVRRARADMRAMIENGDVDLLFANEAEARELSDLGEGASVQELAESLAPNVGLVAVTDGSHGSWLIKGDSTYLIPPFWAETPPVDTCGAGDAYAAGLIFGLLQGCQVEGAGKMAARVACAVIQRTGARLGMDDALELAERLEVAPPEITPHAVRSNVVPSPMQRVRDAGSNAGTGPASSGGAAAFC